MSIHFTSGISPKRTCQAARPNERIAKDGPFEELIVVDEHFVGQFAIKDFIVLLNVGRRANLDERVAIQQRHRFPFSTGKNIQRKQNVNKIDSEYADLIIQSQNRRVF